MELLPVKKEVELIHDLRLSDLRIMTDNRLFDSAHYQEIFKGFNIVYFVNYSIIFFVLIILFLIQSN